MENVHAIITEIELAYKPALPLTALPLVSSSKAAYKIFTKTWNMEQILLFEQFKVILLNQANRALGIFNAFQGGTTFCPVDIRLVLAAALKANATKMVAAHNHPSGTLTPSQDDLTQTKRLAEAGMLLNIRLEDHLIISPEGYYSFRDQGLL